MPVMEGKSIQIGPEFKDRVSRAAKPEGAGYCRGGKTFFTKNFRRCPCEIHLVSDSQSLQWMSTPRKQRPMTTAARQVHNS